MKSILQINLQKLFLITLILKIGSSYLGWYLQMQWSLGFAVPILIMCAYIVLGYFRRDSEVTDEKFADTCYYLGFIFTITSIIFSLFDLPHIGTKIQEIAVRFGAAMVSTVFGLSVRVYLVSFKKDVADAVKEAEDAVLDASRKFTEQLVIALEKLRDFESQVDIAAKSSVERVNLQIENLSKNHADSLTGFFSQLTQQNQESFVSALAEVKTASQRLSESVNGYSNGMRINLLSVEAKVGAFTDAVTNRLKTTTFPDDYFAKHLDAPLTQLKDSAMILAGGVKIASDEVNESSTVLTKALKKMRDKANATEEALDTVLKLTEQQQAVLDASQGQLNAISRLVPIISNVDASLASTASSIAANSVLTSELTTRVTAVVSEGAEYRKSLSESLAAVIGKLDSSSAAAMKAVSLIGEKLDVNSNANSSLSEKLGDSASAAELIVKRLDRVSAADAKAAETLGALGQNASTAIAKVDQVVVHLHEMVSKLGGLATALRSESSERRIEAPLIDDPRSNVEDQLLAFANISESGDLRSTLNPNSPGTLHSAGPATTLSGDRTGHLQSGVHTTTSQSALPTTPASAT